MHFAVQESIWDKVVLKKGNKSFARIPFIYSTAIINCITFYEMMLRRNYGLSGLRVKLILKKG